MSYYETWMDKSENVQNEKAYADYIQLYYYLEKEAYDKILSSYPDNKEYLSGKASDLASKLGFQKNTMDIFVGFLDGIKTSLNKEIDVESVDDDTQIDLDINYKKLFYNMKDAKAKWLFKLNSWKNVLSADEIAEVTREFAEENIAHSAKIGRNDPCPCGSGKKYKKCCGKNA